MKKLLYLAYVLSLVALVYATYTHYNIGFRKGVAFRQQECHDSFDELRRHRVFAGNNYNWPYVSQLLCDGRDAGESK